MKSNYFFKKSYSNIYKSSSKSSEVTSQILYGEKFTILSKDKNWIKIKLTYDDYIGYIKSVDFLNSHKATHKVFIIKAKIYDKLNRLHYRDAKANQMTPSNYVLTHVID